MVAPPIYSRFFRGKTAYAMGKVAMSVLVVGLGMDFEREGLVGKGRGMAVTGVWPAVVSFFSAVVMMMMRFGADTGPEHRVGSDGAVRQAGSGVQKGPAEGDGVFGCGAGDPEGAGGGGEWQVGAGRGLFEEGRGSDRL